MDKQQSEHEVASLLTQYGGGGWRVRLSGGDDVVVVADGVGLDSDPLVFSGVVRRRGRTEEMPVVVMRASDVGRVFWTARVPMAPQRLPRPAAIVSDPIPMWNLNLRGGAQIQLRADEMRRLKAWYMFSFRVDNAGTKWDEPVVFVRASRLVELNRLS
jgi:hypothetical protein